MGNSHPIYIGFASQKGGVGKSSLAEVLASILYYERGVRLLVIDCDGMQESFYKLRERERQLSKENPQIEDYLRSFYANPDVPSHPYHIIRSSPEEALERVDHVLSTLAEPLDVVIFDFPGHASLPSILELSAGMDYVISPIESDVQSLTSSLAYGLTVRDIGVSMEGVRIQDFIFLWNKVDRRASSSVVQLYSQLIQKHRLSLFKSQIYASVRISHEMAEWGLKGVFRSSYLPPPPNLRRGMGIDEWVDELIDITGLGNQ